jgi:hypothetical protein
MQPTVLEIATTSNYLLAFLVALLFVVWPDETVAVLTVVSLNIQLFFINYRMKWMAWRQYRMIVKMSRESNFPAPPPFKFVNLWDRDKK